MPYDGTGLDETTKVLLEARRLVEEGWCQGAYEDAAGRVCLRRALVYGSVLTKAGVGGAEWQAAYLRIIGLLPLLFKSQRGVDYRMQDWNDAHGRTQAEVLAVLDRAIAGGDA